MDIYIFEDLLIIEWAIFRVLSVDKKKEFMEISLVGYPYHPWFRHGIKFHLNQYENKKSHWHIT